MEYMSLLGYAACAPDPAFRASLPFPAFDIDRDAIPPMLRRRSSLATQMAFSVAAAACGQARRDPAALPSIFASVAGEIQTTDQICIELAKPDGIISPSAFHNSVQNTAPGYWGIAQHCTQPASALAAGHDTFAMALLEAWCQFATGGGELLLVCYDETWPDCLDPDRGQPAFACAFVLAAGAVEDAILALGRPERGTAAFPTEWQALADQSPMLAAIPLLGFAAAIGDSQDIPVSRASPAWQVRAITKAPSSGR